MTASQPDADVAPPVSGTGMSKMSSDELALARTGMALRRTLMATDRTLMAWVRTAMSTSSFGFTIYKVMQGFEQSGVLKDGTSPREVGLFLIGLGTAAMVIGIVDHAFVLRELRQIDTVPRRRPTMTIAVMTAVFNLALFVTVFTKVL